MSSESQISLNNNLMSQKFNSGDYTFCIELLKEAFKLKRNEQNEVIHVPPTDETLIIIGEILCNLSPKMQAGCCNESELLLIKQCYQSLRNSTACGEQIQNQITDSTNIIENSYNILKAILVKTDASNIDCLKMELQFLCNLIVSNKNTQLFVWEKFSDLLKISLGHKEVSHIVIMILYNIFKEHKHLLTSEIEFIVTALNLYKENVDNIPLLIELLVSENIFTKVYCDLDIELRLTFLEIIYGMMVDDMIELTHELISVLCDNFKKKSDCILKTVTDYLQNIEPLEVARLLDCISSASSKENYLKQLQDDKSLFINCAFLLKSIQDVGKSGENNFSSIQKLSEITSANNEIQNHPGFGFKAALIRLLGNLCWKHKDNQTMIRELDCIPLFMDCCNIDARNPLIIQWVILAVRNLCDNNKENQAVIAEITKIGVVDSAIVREMGMTLHDDGNNKIGIAPLNLNK